MAQDMLLMKGSPAAVKVGSQLRAGSEPAVSFGSDHQKEARF